MKRILLIAVALFFAMPNMQAQDKGGEVKTVLVSEDNATNYYYEGVVPVEGVTKEEMFKRAKEWVLANFKTGDINTQFDEKEFSIHSSSTIFLVNDLLNFKLSIYFKEGKYKFRFDNLIVTIPPTSSTGAYTKPYGPNMLGKRYTERIMKLSNKGLLSLSTDLENIIKNSSGKKDDW